MEGTIYTRDRAAEIVELFENILDQHDIMIPCDDRTGDEDEGCLYGSVYSDLLDEVEGILCELIDRAKSGEPVVQDEFSGTY